MILSTEALDLRLDEDRDLFVGPNGFELVFGADGVAQLCSIALQLWLGEWFRNRLAGIDWFRLLQEKSPEPEIKASVVRVLVAVPGVLEVTRVTLVRGPDRGASISATVKTAFGDLPISASVGGT